MTLLRAHYEETPKELDERIFADLYYVDYGDVVFQKNPDELERYTDCIYDYEINTDNNGGRVAWLYMNESAYSMMHD